MGASLITVEDEQYVKVGDIITASEIAQLCGVGAPAVSNWRARYDSFPLPFTVVGKGTALFLKPLVITWFAEHIASSYAPEIKEAIMTRLTEETV